ncbi:MAG: DUF362 domain-containing protein [Clostridia bacterium]|nr:DUF362 domain-containing protein [Clostridia bacterium]
MKKTNIKTLLSVCIMILFAIVFACSQLGLFDPMLRSYEEEKVQAELNKINVSKDSVSGASAVPDGNSTPVPDKAAPLSTLSGQSIVSVVQSSKALATDIQPDEISSMVRKAVELGGGFEGLIKDGQTVVIKPNLVQKHSDITGKLFDKELNGITTDWRVTKAVVELVREYNPNGKVYVMEGSAGDGTKATMEHLNYTPEYIPGVDEFIAIEEDSGGWQEFSSPNLVKVSLPTGLLHKQYYLNKKYYEADVLISVPCLKNNSGTVITGGIKNVSIGATPANIYGPAPGNLSRTAMVSHSTSKGDLDRWIHDYYMCKPVDFVIIDGLEGFQNGPVPYRKDSEKVDKMNMRLIMAGKDAVAVDTVAALITGWDPLSAAHLRYLNKSGVGNIDTAKITVLGNTVFSVRKDFATKISNPAWAKVNYKLLPTFSSKNYAVRNNRLNLSLLVSGGANKVEVYINDSVLPYTFTSGYSDISINIDHFTKGVYKVKICVYDRYLYYTEQTIF